MADIGFISLKSKAVFIARLEFEYLNNSTNKWIRTGAPGDITNGSSKMASPGDHGVPDGSLVKLHVKVVAGTDNVSNEVFTFIKGSGSNAVYTISGTTLVNKLSYEGIQALTLTEEQRIIPYKVYFSIQLKTKNAYYISAEKGGGRELAANRKTPSAFETFTLVATKAELEDGIKVGLMTCNNQYVTAINGGGTRPVIATNTTQGSYETFTLRKVAGVNRLRSSPIVNGDKVAFRCASGKHYLSAQDGGSSTSIFHCEPTRMGVNEMFTIISLAPTIAR